MATRTLIVVLLIGSGLGPVLQAGDLDAIRNRGELVMLASPGGNEVFLRSDSDGGWQGLDYEIVSGFARTLGVGLRVEVGTSFPSLLPELLEGRGDLVASTLSITDEREALVDFSVPYFPVAQMVITRQDAAIDSMEAIRGRVGCAPPGSTLEASLRRLGVAEIRSVGGERLIYDAVRDGVADLTLVESTSGLSLLSTDYPELEVAFVLPGVEQYGIAVRPGSDLLAPLDAYLRTVTRGRGFYELVWKHLGERGVEMLRLAQAQMAGENAGSTEGASR